jgi:hypothetical protein
MATVTPLQHGTGATLAQACVAGREAQTLILSLPPGTTIRARRAAGCLLRPEPGDLVLASFQPGGEAYVLCVLERTGDAATLDLAPEVAVTARSGRLELTGLEVALKAGVAVQVAAPALQVDGTTGVARFQDFTCTAGSLTARAGALRLLGQTLETVFDRLVQRVRLSLRWVSELDRLEAGRSHTAVADRCTLRAGSVSLLAEDEVKVDGKRINLG